MSHGLSPGTSPGASQSLGTPPNGARASWLEPLAGRLDALGRWFAGRLVVDPSPDEEVVPADRYRDPAFLEAAIRRAAHTTLHGGAADHPAQPANGERDRDAELDLQIAVSRFTRQYASSVSATALVGLGCGIGVDVSSARCALVVRHNIPFLTTLDVRNGEVMTCAERPAPWPVHGPQVATLDELRAYVWRRLYAEHLHPLLVLAREITGVSPTLLWTNAAEWVGMVPDAAEEYLGPDEAGDFVADCKALLGAGELPGIPGPNPLRDKLTWVPTGERGYPQAVQTRAMCCLTYLLADRFGRLCGNCPFLPLDIRTALIRERHGRPMGAPSGPAEQQAIACGLRRPSARRALKARRAAGDAAPAQTSGQPT